MAVVNDLIHIEGDGTISFGDYTLDTKTKLDNVEYNGDIYKVKTFKEITKLERNGMFVYESVPGTAVNNFSILSARILICPGDSSPDMYRTLRDAAILAHTCNRIVDLPIPGSPPTSTMEPATIPPPKTLSSSPNPVVYLSSELESICENLIGAFPDIPVIPTL